MPGRLNKVVILSEELAPKWEGVQLQNNNWNNNQIEIENHCSTITTPPPQANSLITNERQ